MGEQVRAALSTVRQQQILKSLSEKWEAGGYHQEVVSEKTWLTENPIPPANTHVLENNPDIRSVRSRAVATGRVGTFLPAFGHEDPSIQSERSDYQAELRRWGDTVNDTAFQRYREEQQQELLKAGAETGNKIFDSFDFGSLWGQGPEFILQFTTVVTIIFAVFALSVLDQIGKEQAGTILAAIAGYVLGHATARRTRTDTNTEQPAAPTGKLDQSGDSRSGKPMPETRSTGVAAAK